MMKNRIDQVRKEEDGGGSENVLQFIVFKQNEVKFLSNLLICPPVNPTFLQYEEQLDNLNTSDLSCFYAIKETLKSL